MRAIVLTVGNVAVRDQVTWAYPNGQALGHFRTPVYHMTVAGTNAKGAASKRTFEVLRFGVMCEDGTTAHMVGLADDQPHRIKSWIPTYVVHSAHSKENGAWHVYGNFLIHDGPDNAKEIFATIGCIEVMGASGFSHFNDYLIALSGASGSTREQKLVALGRSGMMTIHYLRATRPALKKW